jgi:hypothetical protein
MNKKTWILFSWMLLAFIPSPGLGQTAEPAPQTPVEIENAFVRATGPGKHNAMVYMTLTNRTGEDDKLTGASSPTAERVELHIITSNRGLRRMHEVDEIPLPSNTPVALTPGNYHLMLIGLKAPLEAGAEVPMELHFAKASPLAITIKVVEFGARRKSED